jgi:hypothetical protein
VGSVIDFLSGAGCKRVAFRRKLVVFGLDQQIYSTPVASV